MYESGEYLLFNELKATQNVRNHKVNFDMMAKKFKGGFLKWHKLDICSH